MQQDFIIHTKMLEILLWSFEKANTFPKKQRFVLGQQLENSCLSGLRFIIEANQRKSVADKIVKLEDLNVELAVLRDLFRVAFELNFLKASDSVN